jgi:hypothetical protein
LVLLAAAVRADSPPPRKKALIIGVDGTRPDALAVARTPNLDRLKANGCFSDRAVTHPVTHSAACWSSMFTGVWGDKHGVNDPGNSFAGNQFGLYPSFFRRLEAVNSNLSTVVYARWAPVTNATQGADVMQAFSSDSSIVTATCSRLASADPDVFFTILLNVDSAGHSYGWEPTVTNYVKAIETADTQVGQIVNALTNRATYVHEDWLVIVLSDHGQHDSTVEKSQLTFHLVWGPSAARGTLWPTPAIVDVCPTVLTHMGVPIDPAWNLDGRVEGLPPRPTLFGANLLFNSGAESNTCASAPGANRCIGWWWDPYGMTLGCYGREPAYPSQLSPGPPNRGRNFFLGGANRSSIAQLLDVSDIAAQVDGPGVEYALGGFFGGLDSREETMLLTAQFLSAERNLLATNAVGGVTARDRDNRTGLLGRNTAGWLPAGTRWIEVVLTTYGPATTNYALADELSLVLNTATAPPVGIVRGGFAGACWTVQFESRAGWNYSLERSTELVSWELLTPGQPGADGPLLLIDLAPPAKSAFYRVKAERR